VRRATSHKTSAGTAAKSRRATGGPQSCVKAVVIGAGSFGRHHIRVLARMPDVELVAIVDADREKLAPFARENGPQLLASLDELKTVIDAAVIVTPTNTHEALGARLLESGVDVLIEKPIASSARAGERLTELAERHERILQVGHLERFNPAIIELQKAVTIPLFFEVHRLSVFTQRSLDIDVVLDLMIHDLNIILSLTKQTPSEIRAAGISVLSPKVDIANVRLAFPSGCIANLTASRVSTEKVRKLRLFQPSQYISVDYARQDAISISVSGRPAAEPKIGFKPLPVQKAEPLELELASFVRAVRSRTPPIVDGRQATEALRLAEAILDKIKEHGELVAETLRSGGRAASL
jgi:predicted dehydrogenase